MNFIKNNKGITLPHLIVAISIITVLAAGAIFAEDAISRTGRAKDAKRWQDIKALAKAVELYQIDNDALPSDLNTTSIDVDQKFVLCSSAASRTCDGQTRACFVLDDADFLDNYLGGSLPIDPEKTSTTDTGYYISKTGGKMTFGACDPYEDTNIEYIAKATVADYQLCGNGITEGTETCDDGDLVNEGCGNAAIETAGTYCNSTCTTVINIASDEHCDSNLTNGCYDTFEGDTFYSGSYKYNITYCSKTTQACNATCDNCVFACQQ